MVEISDQEQQKRQGRLSTKINQGRLCLGPITIVVLSILAPLHILWPHFILEKLPFHSAIEAIGAIVAISIAVALLRNEEERFYWIALGLLAAGLFDGFHAVVLPGHGFILLHSAAIFFGGFWFMFIWLPEQKTPGTIKNLLPWIVVLSAIAFGIYTTLFRETLPAMKINNEFTAAAIMLNALGGLFLLAAAVRLLMYFLRYGKLEDYLFFCMALLFGLSGLMFKFSRLWDDVWWFWHFLRLSAYLFIMGFMVTGYFQKFAIQRAVAAQRRRAEEGLKSSEKKYRDLVDNAIVGIYWTNIKGEVLFANRAMLDIFEYNAFEEFQKDGVISRYKNSEDRRAMIEQLKKTGKLTNYEIAVLTKTGQDKNVLISAALEGGILSGMVIDITERKRLEDALQKRLAELEKFQKITLGREDRMIELKQEVNARLKELGRQPKYGGESA